MGGIWIDHATLLELPTSGDAWDRLESDARGSWGSADISNQDNRHDVYTFAGALVAARLNDDALRSKVIDACREAMGTESGSRALAVARQLTGYVLAADLVDYYADEFVEWVRSMLTFPTTSGPKSLVASHEERPNNWGTHAGAARTAAAMYVGDTAELQRAATVFRGLLGDRTAYSGFKFGDLAWQSDPANPVAINPLGARIDGHDVDGALPEELRRSGGFTWPPPKQNYCWEAMQGIVTQAWLLRRAGYADVHQWSDEAILRAYAWLVAVADFQATGDDAFVPYLIDALYGFKRIDPSPAGTGKSVGYTDWTHANVDRVPGTEPPAEPAEEPPAEEPAPEEPAEEPAEEAVTIVAYYVRPGDSLYRIAQQHGTTVTRIATANPWLNDPNLIKAGWVLQVPIV